MWNSASFFLILRGKDLLYSTCPQDLVSQKGRCDQNEEGCMDVQCYAWGYDFCWGAYEQIKT